MSENYSSNECRRPVCKERFSKLTAKDTEIADLTERVSFLENALEKVLLKVVRYPKVWDGVNKVVKEALQSVRE